MGGSAGSSERSSGASWDRRAKRMIPELRVDLLSRGEDDDDEKVLVRLRETVLPAGNGSVAAETRRLGREKWLFYPS